MFLYIWKTWALFQLEKKRLIEWNFFNTAHGLFDGGGSYQVIWDR